MSLGLIIVLVVGFSPLWSLAIAIKIRDWYEEESKKKWIKKRDGKWKELKP